MAIRVDDPRLPFWEAYARVALPAVLAETAAMGMAHNAPADEDDDERRRRDRAAEMTALITLRGATAIEARHRRAYLETVLDALRPAGRACLDAMALRDDEIGAVVRRQLLETIGPSDSTSRATTRS